MKRVCYNNMLKEYKNGNITIKLDKETLSIIDNRNDVEILYGIIGEFDLDFIGETFCISNFDAGHLIYNFYSDKIYIFVWSDLDKLKQGKAVKLYARTPDEYDREILEREGY